MDIGSVAIWLMMAGYDYAEIASCANDNDCSFEQAMMILFQKNS